MSLPSGELGSDRAIQELDWEVSLRAERYNDLAGHPAELSIISVNSGHKPSETYMRYKHRAGDRLGIHVASHVFGTADEALAQIETDNASELVNGIIVQLPVNDAERSRTKDILDSVLPEKDVDGLATNTFFVPATVRAIEKWGESHSIDFTSENVTLMGLGLLVNEPFFRRLRKQGARHIEAFDKFSDDLDKVAGLNNATVIVTAMGHPDVQLTPEMFRPDTMQKVLIDVGTAEQSGIQRGDVSEELRQYAIEHNWGITPIIGGIGKITVHALMENVMDAAEQQAGITQPFGEYLVSLSLAATSSLRAGDAFEVERDDLRAREEQMMEGAGS